MERLFALPFLASMEVWQTACKLTVVPHTFTDIHVHVSAPPLINVMITYQIPHESFSTMVDLKSVVVQ